MCASYHTERGNANKAGKNTVAAAGTIWYSWDGQDSGPATELQNEKYFPGKHTAFPGGIQRFHNDETVWMFTKGMHCTELVDLPFLCCGGEDGENNREIAFTAFGQKSAMLGSCYRCCHRYNRTRTYMVET